MRISVEIDQQSKAAAKKLLSDYARLTGNGIETGVKEIAVATAKRLAHKIQPFGFNKIEKFEKSIQSQVKRAVQNANVQGATGSIEQAHASRRNTKGQVPKSIRTQAQYKGKPFDPQLRARLQEKKAKNAGLAKASFVEAGNLIVDAPTKGARALKKIKVPQTVNRHIGNGNGTSGVSGSGSTFTVFLTSKISYIRKVLSDSKVQAALKEGMINGYKKLSAHIKRETKRISKI